MLLRCTVNGDVALYISNTMHPFRFHSSLCPRCCYYQSRHHSFDMTGPVFPFICNGQEILNHFIFQAQQHLFFKKRLSSLSVSISCFLPCLILCAMFIRQSFYSLSPVLFCFCAHPSTPFLSLSPHLACFSVSAGHWTRFIAINKKALLTLSALV